MFDLDKQVSGSFFLIKKRSKYDPDITSKCEFNQFVECVPMIKKRIDRKASTPTGYCWLVWEKDLQT
jgi:hypothetical protein